MTLDELRTAAAQHDARLRQLFDPESRQKRRTRTSTSAPTWVNATAPQERPSASIMDGLQTYRGTIAVPRKTVRGQGITINPNNPAPGAPAQPDDPARLMRDMEIRALAKTGRTHRQIAAIVGTSISTVGRVLRKSTPEAPAA